jgi:hypothetical protein
LAVEFAVDGGEFVVALTELGLAAGDLGLVAGLLGGDLVAQRGDDRVVPGGGCGLGRDDSGLVALVAVVPQLWMHVDRRHQARSSPVGPLDYARMARIFRWTCHCRIDIVPKGQDDPLSECWTDIDRALPGAGTTGESPGDHPTSSDR